MSIPPDKPFYVSFSTLLKEHGAVKSKPDDHQEEKLPKEKPPEEPTHIVKPPVAKETKAFLNIEIPETPKELLELVEAAKVAGSKTLAHFLEQLNRKSLIELYQHTKNQDVLKILGQKIAIRQAFQKSVEELSTQGNNPTCFVCFALEEDVTSWLEEVFVPDMELAKVQPIVCFKQFGPGQELNHFQTKIRYTDKVVVICTPLLKQYCQERVKNPTGVAQEIRLACERYNDEKFWQSIFPVFVKGSREETCPTPLFEPILGTVLYKNKAVNGVKTHISYYENVFELFGAIKGVPRPESRKIKREFFAEVDTILKQDKWNFEELAHWSVEKKEKTAELLRSISNKVTQEIQLFDVPPFSNDFTGRKEEIEILRTLCMDKNRIAITGLGGLGKSTLAKAFAHQYSNDFQFVYFVSGERELLKVGLLKLADALLIPDAIPEQRLDLLKDRLNQIDRKYLIVLDGIDEEEAYNMLDSFLPNVQGCFLMTTRMKEHARSRKFEIYELPSFHPDEAMDFLSKATGDQEKQNAKTLCEKLGFLPLALSHAAAYIRAARIKIPTYLSLFEEQGVSLFSRESLIGLPANERTILTTWRVSLHELHKKVADSAQHLLGFISHLADAPIPLKILELWAENHPDPYQKTKLYTALGWLREYSLIESPKLEIYTIHPLLKQVIFADPLMAEDHDTHFQAAFQVLGKWCQALYLPNHRFEESLENCLLPHGRHLLEKKKKEYFSEEALWVFLFVGMRTGMLESRYEELLTRLERDDAPLNATAGPDRIPHHQREKALCYLNDGIQLALKKDGMNSYLGVLFRHGKSLILREQEKGVEAASEAEKAIFILTNFVEVPTIVKGSILREAGMTFLFQSAVEKAQECLNLALASHQHIKGPELFLTYASLATLFTAKEAFEEAKIFLDKILKMLDENPVSLKRMKFSPTFQLALVFYRQGKKLTAESFLHLIHEWTSKSYEDKINLEIIKTRLHLALIISDDHAIPMLEQLCKDLEIKGFHGMALAFIHLRLAEIYKKGEFEKAATHIEYCKKWSAGDKKTSPGRKVFNHKLADLERGEAALDYLYAP